MSDTVIKVENLSKQYRIGTKEGYKTFRETLVDAAKAPFLRVGGAMSKAINSMRPAPSSMHAEGTSALSAPGSPLLSTDDTIWALKDVSFEVKRGEVVGIIGRNGAGKTTLLKILSRITEPTKGRVELRGRVGSLLEVGTGFHPELTGHENVYMYGAILGMDRWEVTRKFDEIVAFAELEKFIETPVKRYSSGMYMRLAFAVAAHMETEILLIDEVLAVGDTAFQKKCLGKMKDVAGEGRTVLFVSHNMTAVQHICHRSILIENGLIVIDEQTNYVIDKYIGSALQDMSSFVDLRKHSNRLPNATPFFTYLEIVVKGERSNIIRMGEGLTIKLRYKSTRNLNGLKVGITINNRYGDRLINFSPSHQCPEALENAPDTGEIICEVPSMNLVPNSYYITVISSDNTSELDRIESCCFFQVLETDVFKTGKSPDHRHGVLYLPANWSVS